MSALDELRESLRAAANRDVEAHHVRRVRRHRRATGAIVLVLLGGAAVAGAADLISVGEPVPGLPGVGAAYKPQDSNGIRVAVRARSDDPKMPYGVGVYRANNGQRCAVAGQVLGYSLGAVGGGKFRPYTRDRSGLCAKPGKATHTSDAYNGRTLVFGLTGERDHRVSIRGTEITREVGPNGAFLFVFDGKPPPNGYPVIIE